MFSELDSIHKNDPKGYMDLVKSMRDGNFDREVSDDTSSISPQTWLKHFSELLSKNVSSNLNTEHEKFIEAKRMIRLETPGESTTDELKESGTDHGKKTPQRKVAHDGLACAGG